jgi:hypothetical protein
MQTETPQYVIDLCEYIKTRLNDNNVSCQDNTAINIALNKRSVLHFIIDNIDFNKFNTLNFSWASNKEKWSFSNKEKWSSSEDIQFSTETIMSVWVTRNFKSNSQYTFGCGFYCEATELATNKTDNYDSHYNFSFTDFETAANEVDKIFDCMFSNDGYVLK